MDPTLKAFLETTTQPAEARIKMVDLIGRFRSTLSERDTKIWPRWRFAKELAVGGGFFGVCEDKSSQSGAVDGAIGGEDGRAPAVDDFLLDDGILC